MGIGKPEALKLESSQTLPSIKLAVIPKPPNPTHSRQLARHGSVCSSFQALWGSYIALAYQLKPPLLGFACDPDHVSFRHDLCVG